jgi:molybdopterin/thiamine biosynthesis adenylyltransferase
MTDKRGKIQIQFRLWGEGQILICNARILALNCDSVACEILKNLVLSGTGFIGVVDNNLITKSDIQENFFINQNDLDKPRGQICLENLLELNPNDVKGEFYHKTPEEFCKSCSIELQTFDLIISTNLSDVI